MELILNLVSQLIYDMDPNHDGSISFDEFLLVMRHIEDRMKQSTANLSSP